MKEIAEEEERAFKHNEIDTVSDRPKLLEAGM